MAFPLTNLVSYYKLDTSSADSVGSNNGTDTAITYSYANGKIQGGAGFNGTSSNINIGSSATLQNSTFTYAAWINPTSLSSGNPNIISGPGGFPALRIKTDGGVKRLNLLKQGVTDLCEGTSAINTGTYTHIALTYNNSTGAYVFYINGSVDKSGTISTQTWTFGTTYLGNASGEYWNGSMDEVGIWSSVLSASDITALYNSGNGLPLPISRNLVSYWKLEDTADSVGSNTLTNNNSVTFVAGKIGNAADFGSSNSNKSLTVASQLGLAKNDARSISVWVQVTTNPSSNNVAVFNATQYNSSGVGYDIEYHNNGGTYQLRVGRWRNGTDDAHAYIRTLTVGTWYHIVYTFSGTAEVVYLNGVQLGTNSPTIADGTAGIGDTFNIGNNTFGRYLSGLVDELGVWSRTLSSDEVSQLFNSGRGNAYPLTDNPSLYGGLGYWKLDESSGNASDSIGSNTAVNTSTTYGTGKINNGAVFNGSSSRLNTSSNYSLSTGDFTLSHWFKKAANTGNMGMVTTRDADTSGFSTAWGNSDNKVSVFIRSNTGDDIITYGTAITDTNWHHLLVTRLSGTMRLYIDGSDVGNTSSARTMNNSNGFAFGYLRITGGTAPDHFFNGTLDEILVANRAFSPTEVSQLFLHGGGVQYPFANKGNFLNFTQ